MTVWRLETLRLVRTLRGVGLLSSFLVFGIVMPILTRYQDALFRNLGGDVQVIAPPPTPPLGLASYLQNSMQIGLLVGVLVAAGSLTFDARPEWAAFLRTRSPVARLVVPKVVVNGAAIVGAFVLGLVAAWVGTSLLIGRLPPAALAGGAVTGALYLGFAVSVVAASAGVMRSTIGAAGIAVVVLIALPILGQLRELEPWLPSTLVGAPTAIAEGEAVSSFARAAFVAVAATAVLVWAAVRSLERREV